LRAQPRQTNRLTISDIEALGGSSSDGGVVVAAAAAAAACR